MPAMNLTKSAASIDRARAHLADVLVDGGDTEAARSNLNDALTKHRELEAKQSEAERVTSPEDEVALADETDVLLTFAKGSAAERLSRFVPALPAAPELDGGLAEALIRARYDDAEQRKRIGEHDEKRQTLQGRIDEVRQRRSEILSRRLSGESDDEMDARQVALADADLEGLQALIAEHEKARPAEPQAEAYAAAAWRHGCEVAELESLRDYAARLQSALLAAGDELSQRRNALGVGNASLRVKIDARLRQATMSGVL